MRREVNLLQRVHDAFKAVRQLHGAGRQRQHRRAHHQENQAQREINRVVQRFLRQREKAQRENRRFALHEEQVQNEREDDDKSKRLHALRQI